MLIHCKYNGYSRDGIRLYYGKDGGGDYPPPDPALIAAQIKSLGVQDKALEQLLANSEKMQPLLMEQTKFGLDSAKTAFDQAQADRTYSLERRENLTGLQDKQIEEANEFDAESVGNERAGKAMADVGQQAALQAQATERSLSRRGVDPTSGNAMAARAGTDLATVSAKVAAGTQQKDAARTEGRMLIDRATNSLSGFPSMSMAANGQGAGFGASGINIAATGQNAMNSGFSSAISGAGAMGSNATSAFNSQANYQLQGNQMNAQQDGALMNSLGTVAGMFMASSEKLKKNFRGLKPGEGLDMVEDIPVKRWTYKEDSGHFDGKDHIGPMAEDVQRVAGEDVAPGGEKIDVINMNGITMSAIQDLSNEVKNIKRMLFKGGMRQPEMAVAA